jgi:predicted GNAT family acetyltransferase
MQVHRYPNPALFLTRAEPWLMRAEAEHNLMLGLYGSTGSPRPVVGDQCYLATVEDAGEVLACAVRTPPHKAIITDAEPEALECLVDDLATKYETLPAVIGPEPAVSRFAHLWSNRTGIPARAGMRQRLLEARQVHRRDSRPAGVLRVAEEADLPIIARWAAAFYREVRLADSADPEQAARNHVGQGSVFVWDNGRPVSMAAWAGRTKHGVRIRFVYTPPEHRRGGYASECVAELTQRLLDEGRTFCCLYTDLANATSNRIYQAIGYRRVCEMSDFHFGPA